MKREKTKHKGIYKVGEIYYITYYEHSKKHEKAVGPKLSMALKEKMDREKRIKSGRYEVMERQERISFDELMQFYQREGDRKEYILGKGSVYLSFFSGRKLSQITRKDLFSFRDHVKSTPKQRGGEAVTEAHVNRTLAGLRRLFNFAVGRELMESNPFPSTTKSGLFYPEKKGLRNFFTEEQIEKMLEASPEWLRPMVLTAYYTGLRESELRGLRWEWIDLNSGVIYLPSSKTLKDTTGLGQRIVMQRELIDLFQGVSKRGEWVFSKPDGTPYEHWNIFKPFRKVLRFLGIDTKQYSWKELRHTTASLMHLKGVPALAIKDQLRHTTVKTTEGFYIGTDIEYQRQQAEKLGLNSGKIVGNATPQEPSPIASA
jgi:integrase